MNRWTHFVTITCDPKKHTEESFRKKLRKCLSNLHTRRGWKYMGVFEYGEANGSIHFHALMYIPEDEMIGKLVRKSEYSTKRKNRRTRYGNTFFDEYFGISDFQEVNPVLLKRGGTSRYLVKYITKTGEKIVYSRGIAEVIYKELGESDIVGTYLDFVISGQEIHYELTNLGAEPTLLINGEKTYCKVSVKKTTYKETDLPEYYNHEYYTYSFMIDGAKSTLYNGDSLRIGTIDKWADGLRYDGFEKGAAQVSFTLKNGIANGVFVLEKISNQGLTSVHLGKGEKIAPMIAFDGSFGSLAVEKDSTVLVPMAYVYDVFDAKSSVSMSIMSSNGTEVLKKSPAATYSFTASEYGIYYVSYDVRDSKGNTDTLNYLIVVSDDIAPTLAVNGDYQSEYKGKVKIHSATATDNVDGELPVTVWIEKTDMTTRQVTMGETVSLEKGKYMIIYYTMDKNGNFAVKRFEIQVK